VLPLGKPQLKSKFGDVGQTNVKAKESGAYFCSYKAADEWTLQERLESFGGQKPIGKFGGIKANWINLYMVAFHR
jgi:hypothetical protein